MVSVVVVGGGGRSEVVRARITSCDTVSLALSRTALDFLVRGFFSALGLSLVALARDLASALAILTSLRFLSRRVLRISLLVSLD